MDAEAGPPQATLTYRERVDLPFYRRQVEGFLPDRILDFHTHVYLSAHFGRVERPRDWAEYVSPRTWPLGTLRRYYERVLPGKTVTPVIFGMPLNGPDLDAGNRLVAESAARGGAYAFLLTDPRWSAEALAQRLDSGPFRGLKPYPTMAPAGNGSEVGVFDFLPPHHLDVAQDRGIAVILHLPRPGRLADPNNLEELHRICERWPALKLVVAHLGRAYCPPTAEQGLAQLRDCPNLRYDISAAANADVFELALRLVGARRLVFGSDLPAVAFRARRYCEGDNYVNVVRRTTFTDSHLRPADDGERDTITFYLYEQIAAFRAAAERVGLSRADVEDVFRNNAERLLHG